MTPSFPPTKQSPAGEECAYCGLPLPRSFSWGGPWRNAWSRKDTPPQTAPQPAQSGDPLAEPRYCCSGCRFAAAVSSESSAGVACNPWLVKILLSVFFTLNVTVFTMALWSSEVYGHTAQNQAAFTSAPAILLADLFRWLSFLLSLPVVWMLGEPLLAEALAQLRRGRLAVDLLLLIGVWAALGYSFVSVWRGTGAIYCEVACVVLLFVTLGRWLESLGKQRAAVALESLAQLLPKNVVRLPGFDPAAVGSAPFFDPGEEIPIEAVQSGDCLRVRAGERIPVDGKILVGIADVDEQLLTGESLPQVRQSGNPVRGGSLVLDGSLVIECVLPANRGSLSRMIRAVQEAQRSRGDYQVLAERVAAFFLPATIVIALCVLFFHGWQGAWVTGGMKGLAVVLIACPCALGIATPLAIWTAVGRASQSQVLFRRGDALERLAAVNVVAFDKTGTLTRDVAEVSQIICHTEITEQDALARGAELALHSPHPFSQALANFQKLTLAGQRPIDDAATIDSPFAPPLNGRLIRSLPGRGLVAFAAADDIMANGTASSACNAPQVPLLALGNHRLMAECGFEWPPELRDLRERQRELGWAVSYVGWKGKVQAGFVFRETPRAEAFSAIDELRQSGLETVLLSGDEPRRVETFSKRFQLIGIGGLAPEEKVAWLQKLQRQGRIVVMVGDGVNDAPALAAADIGFSLGCGADLSRQSASICLLGNDLGRIAWSIALAKQTLRIVRMNLFWAFVYNIAGIGLAVGGLLNPIWAAAFMVVSSLLVIVNSMRLAKFPLPTEVPHSTRIDAGIAPFTNNECQLKDNHSQRKPVAV
ncbi:MAG: cation-translocating P-type ATPase [Pirellulales bacterium]|nr:cation-translocating P-type ATPase [Pirellulales bacterium]